MLFLPSFLVIVWLFVTLNNQHQRIITEQFKFTARHLIFHIGDSLVESMHHRRYGELKKVLSDFADKSELHIDNIMIYGLDGQFITALRLTEELLESSLPDFSGLKFEQNDHTISAYGPIYHKTFPSSDEIAEDFLGYIRVVFVEQGVSLVNMDNILLILVLLGLSMLAGLLLWRYRYGEFHRSVGQVIDFLEQHNSGRKQAALVDNGHYYELNQLRQKINGMMGFYEKRLTMKQFEITGLEQKLLDTKQLNDQHDNLDKKHMSSVEIDKPIRQADLFTAMYQVVFQRLQAQYAMIESAIIDDLNAHRLNQSQDNQYQQQHRRLFAASKRLNQLLSEIKMLADATTDKLRQPKQYISLDQFISSISHFVIPLANEKALEFVLCQPDRPLDVELDINQSLQVLIAIMQSAVAVSDKGYIKLSVELQSLQSNHKHTNEYQLCCKVQDTGAGLIKPQLDLLVNGRVDDCLADDVWLDQGLRLVVAKTIVERMEGSFTVKSLKGLGSEISVVFNCKVSFSSVQDLSAYNGCEILVYDPFYESGIIINDKLYEHGLLASYCRSFEEVQTALNENRMDCIICCRPVEPQIQQEFDQALSMLIAQYNINHGLVVSATATLPFNLPNSWMSVEKPFALSMFLDYFHPDMFEQSQMLINKAVQGSELDQNAIVILAVDDNETNLRLLQSVMRDTSVNLVTCLSGREALTLSQQRVFDLILMDKEMPQMDGVETSINIRKLPMNKTTPIVLFSASVDDDERRYVLANGLDDCIEKPLNTEKLELLMNKFCYTRWLQFTTGTVTT